MMEHLEPLECDGQQDCNIGLMLESSPAHLVVKWFELVLREQH